MGKRVYYVIILMMLMVFFCACGGDKEVFDEEYESQVIIVEGLPSGEATITVAELRALPQYELDASYQRTTGLTEEFHMKGPYLREVIAELTGDLSDYEGVGVLGTDGYYCLLSREVIEATPDLMLALSIDGLNTLEEDLAPAQLAVQGQFGPYWVKKVERIILYSEVPEKEITSLWVFGSLTEGIEPYMYEYYGSKDVSFELEQIFTRFDHVDSRAFFTMKSADGFVKNEVINMVKSRYYIKSEGEDAPTNVSPHIKLGMNVHHIAWFSTNADAVMFLPEMMKYMDTVEISGRKGIPISEAMYETGTKALRGNFFRIAGAGGEALTVPGEDLSKGILVPGKDGAVSVVWQPETGYAGLENLMRINVTEEEEEEITPAAYSTETRETVLTISGDGLSNTLYFTLEDLIEMYAGYAERIYSTLNNWPSASFAAAKGIDISYLFSQIGLKSGVETVKVESNDGYSVTFTMSQLTGPAYCYYAPENGGGVVEVKPMLAWEFRSDTDDLSLTRQEDLRLVVGQNGVNCTNTVAMVKSAAKITFSREAPGSWPEPDFHFEDGMLTIVHDFMDQVKIYYTTDGSQPNVNRSVYNPSTTYFQPHLIKPIPMEGVLTVKAIAVGYGRSNSETAVYENE